MKARLGTKKVLHFFDTGSEVGASTFVATVTESDGTQVAELSMTQVTETPALYISSAYTPTEAGSLNVFYVYNDIVIGRESLDVGQPLTDAALSTDTVFSYDALEAGGTAETLTLYVFDSAGKTAIPDGDDDPISAVYDASYSGYIATVSFDEEGDYFFVWAKDGVPFDSTDVLVLKPYGLENIRFYCATLLGNNGTPHMETVTIVSKSDGEQVAIGQTDVSGLLNLQVPSGDYVVSILKSGVAYSVNNFNITVGDSISEGLGPRQTFQLITNSFEPTTSDPQDDASMCELFVSIYRMDGSPLAHAPVHVRMISSPQLYNGTTVYDSQLFFKTDSNGRASFELIQGLKVEVAIPPLGLRRIITVPSGDDAAAPVNLFTLLSAAKDLFDIQKPQIQKAPRRTR
jgi:hypothetical protein